MRWVVQLGPWQTSNLEISQQISCQDIHLQYPNWVFVWLGYCLMPIRNYILEKENCHYYLKRDLSIYFHFVLFIFLQKKSSYFKVTVLWIIFLWEYEPFNIRSIDADHISCSGKQHLIFCNNFIIFVWHFVVKSIFFPRCIWSWW